MRRRHGLVDPAERLEQRVRGCRIRDVIALARKGAEAHLDEVVATVAEGNFRGMQVEMGGDGGASRRRSRAWIKAQRIAGRGLDRLDDLGRWRQGRFVGVELDPALLVRRLLAGSVRFEAPKGLFQEAFRHSSKNVSMARRGLTFCSR